MKEYRLVGAFALTIAMLCIAGVAQAQTRVTACSATTANNELCISIAAATIGTNDGKPGVTLTQPPVFRIEQKFGSGAYVQIATGVLAADYLVKNLAPGDYVFRVYQNCVSVPNVVNCTESAPTTSSSKSIAVPTVTPNAPVIIIAATIRAGQPPTYRIVYTVRPREGEIVFVAPESMRQAFASR
jgi:hypothetical protein